MPMEKPADFGIEADGAQSQEYCVFCYANGSFIEPDITFEQMVEKCSRMTAKAMNVSEEEASSIVRTMLPTLKRWSGLSNQ